MNWVDRKFARERNLGKATAVWNSSIAAIHDAVKSFTDNGEYGTAQIFPQNGDRILVEVEQPQHENAHIYIADPKRRVQIAFDPATPAITAAVDGSPVKTFPLEADETHCFLKFGGVEISPDEFSKHALNEAFFTPKTLPPPRRVHGATHRPTTWS
jgi:hypothetical protein